MKKQSGMSILSSPLVGNEEFGGSAAAIPITEEVTDLFFMGLSPATTPSKTSTAVPTPARALSPSIDQQQHQALSGNESNLRIPTGKSFVEALMRSSSTGKFLDSSPGKKNHMVRRVRSHQSIWKVHRPDAEEPSSTVAAPGDKLVDVERTKEEFTKEDTTRSLFRVASLKALAQHRERWQKLAHSYSRSVCGQDTSQEFPESNALESSDLSSTWHYILSPLSKPHSPSDLIGLALDDLSDERLKDDSQETQQNLDARLQERSGVSNNDSMGTGDLELLEQQFWTAVGTNDPETLQQIIDPSKPRYLRDWDRLQFHCKRPANHTELSEENIISLRRAITFSDDARDLLIPPPLVLNRTYSLASSASSDSESAESVGEKDGIDALSGLSYNKYGKLPPLHIAAALGNETCLNVLLEAFPRNGSVDLKDRRFKCPPILYAAESGSLKCVKLLKKFGASIDAKDRQGETALHKAVRADSDELVQWLCRNATQYNLKLNARNKKQNTPLLLVRSQAVAMTLIKAGADPTVFNTQNLDIACVASIRGNKDLLETVLLANTAYERQTYAEPVEAIDFMPEPILMKVSPRSRSRSGSFGSSLQSPTSGRRSRSGSLGNYILPSPKEGARTQLGSTVERNTPRSRSESFDAQSHDTRALRWPHMEDVRALNLKSPLHLAVYHGHIDCVDVLCGIFNNSYGNISSVSDSLQSLIVRDHVTVSSLDYHDWKTGWTPLHLACIYGHKDVVKVLIKHGSSHLKEDRQGCISIVLGAFFGHVDLVSSLEGVDYVNSKGETVLDTYIRLKTRQYPDIKDFMPYIDNLEAYFKAFPAHSSSDPAVRRTCPPPPPPSRRKGETAEERQSRESHLLHLLVEDLGFMALLSAGAPINEEFLKQVTSPLTYDRIFLRKTAAMTTTRDVPHPNEKSVASIMERTWFLQQDRRFCDVTILCRSDTTTDWGSDSDNEYATTDGDLVDMASSSDLPGKRVIYAHKNIIANGSKKLAGMIDFVTQQLREGNASTKHLLLQLDDLDYSRGCQIVYYLYKLSLVADAKALIEEHQSSWKVRSGACSASSVDEDLPTIPCGDDVKVDSYEAGGGEDFEEEDITWLINLLLVADEYIMADLMEAVIDDLIRVVEKRPSLAPAVLVHVIDLDIPNTQVLLQFCAWLSLLHHVENRKHSQLDEISAVELIKTALSQVIISSEPE